MKNSEIGMIAANIWAAAFAISPEGTSKLLCLGVSLAWLLYGIEEMIFQESLES